MHTSGDRTAGATMRNSDLDACTVGCAARIDVTLAVVEYLVYSSTMIKVNVHEAKTRLSEYLDRLERGEEDVVTICRRNEPIAELRALPKRPRTARPIFRRDPRFRMPKRFLDPLPEEVLDGFEGRS
jgi:antitoxin (DNA-binding transcriptional repressor) of toxin-antitoxin stability system